ncbi:MAG: NosD domain-containing protein, partial [Promethearchaeota archaeon]
IATANGLDGVQLWNSNNTLISGNTANNNTSLGFRILTSHDNMIINNTMNSNGDLKISSDTNNTIPPSLNIYLSREKKNSKIENGGVSLENSSYNYIIKNHMRYNIDNGMFLKFSDNNRVYNNSAFNNVLGIHLLNSNENQISDNKISRNYAGIKLTYSNLSILTKNIMRENSIGIYSIYSKSNNIFDNFFYNNLNDMTVIQSIGRIIDAPYIIVISTIIICGVVALLSSYFYIEGKKIKKGVRV